MDPISWDALKFREQIIKLSDINLEKDYFIIGHHDNRRSSYQWTDYPLYLVKAADLLAPVANNRDRQMSTASAATGTSSITYVDLSGISLTTNELDPVLTGATGNYQIHFSCDYDVSDVLTAGQFILNINGADVIPTATLEGLTGGRLRTTIIWQADTLLANTIIKIRYKVIPGNLGSVINVYNRTLMIDGVNTLTII
jgi:hypothetical protein